MKNTLITLAAFVLLGLGVSTASASESISLGLHLGVPYYQNPPSYYAPADEPMWRDTPVEIIYIDGAPHQMHMWQGRWYDEAWAGPRDHHVNASYRNNWNDNIHGGRRW